MSRLSKIILAVTLGLILAACIHLMTILAMPTLGEKNAYNRAAEMHAITDTITFTQPALSGPVPSYYDPAVAMSGCTFDLAEGALRVIAPVASLPMSLSVHDVKGGVLYAIPDRAATRGQIAVVLMTRRQLDERIARDSEDEPVRDLRVPLPASRGLVVLRAVGQFPSQKALAEAAAGSLSCTLDTP